MKKIYIAGPMSNLPELNFPAFHAAAALLHKGGHFVVNPADINGGADELVATAHMTEGEMQAHWQKCMRNDIRELVTCDAIYLLPGWERSRGATLEHHIAQALGMEIIEQ